MQKITTIVKNKENTLIYSMVVLFIIVNAFLTSREIYFANILPLALLIAALAFVALDKLLFIIVFLTPLSVPLREFMPQLGIDMYLPTEPLLFGVMLIFFMKLLYQRNFDRKIALHPVSIAIYTNLLWIFITSITSTMPVVSFKFLLSRLWFVCAFYFLATQLLNNKKNIKTFVWLYIIAFIPVIFYSIIRLSTYGLFDQEVANWIMEPFYNDHTSYGAMLAMYFPFILAFITRPIYDYRLRLITVGVLAIFIVAIILSYTRAAWVSLVGALGVWVLIKLRISFKLVFVTLALLLTLFFTFQTQIMFSLEKNRQDSSENLAEHIKSITNIATDASNLERLNRWNAAFDMFIQKPVLGWGAGTYTFQYAPFQHSQDRTIISTNVGDKGNAHSEYIGPLAEMGILGMVTLLIIVILVIKTAIRVYYQSNDKEMKVIIMSALLGLITYYLHGFLNNFLDTDKASVPFWGFTAIIVAYDVFLKNKQQQQIEK